jgi:hypothetical protein
LESFLSRPVFGPACFFFKIVPAKKLESDVLNEMSFGRGPNATRHDGTIPFLNLPFSFLEDGIWTIPEPADREGRYSGRFENLYSLISMDGCVAAAKSGHCRKTW